MEEVMKKILLIAIFALTCATLAGCGNSTPAQESSTEISASATEASTNATSTPVESTEPTEKPTKPIFDVTQAYVNKPYSNDFALQRVDELQYIDEESLYHLFSDNESPEFYDGFFNKNDTFNVNMDTYNYDIDNEIYRQYCDTYQYSQIANRGAIRVIDSFVYNDSANNKMLYYCYYTITTWGEGETLDTLDYYRDVITLNTQDKTLNVQPRIAIKTGLQVPKEITGYHDFHGVI